MNQVPYEVPGDLEVGYRWIARGLGYNNRRYHKALGNVTSRMTSSTGDGKDILIKRSEVKAADPSQPQTLQPPAQGVLQHCHFPLISP